MQYYHQTIKEKSMKKISFAILSILLFSSSITAQTEFIFEANVISNTAKLFSEPKANSKTVRTLKRNEKILTTTTISKQGWYYVSVNKTKGWIHGNDFKFLDAWQSSIPYEVKTSVSSGWYLIDETNDKQNGYRYYYLRSSIKWNDSDLRKYGLKPDVEFWTRTVPFNPQKYLKDRKLSKNLAYILEYVSLYCKEKRLSTEKMVLYDNDDQSIPFNDIFYLNRREPIVPNSIGESVWSKFCSE